MFAGCAALVYLALDGWLRGDGPWRFANLFAAAFYPGRARHFGFSWATVTGIAAELVVAGLLGVAFAWMLSWTLRRRWLRVFASVVLALGWYYFSLQYLWMDWNPRLVVHQPFPGFLIAHCVYGFAMALLPRVLAEIQSEEPAGGGFGDPAESAGD